MLRPFIYFFKRLIHKSISFYQFIYSVLTLNARNIKQRLSAGQYPSKFGGMWTDRKDYFHTFDKKILAGIIGEDDKRMLAQWRDYGYVTLEQAVDGELIDQYLEELNKLKEQEKSPLLMTSVSLKSPTPFNASVIAEQYSARTVDDYYFSEASRQILMNKKVMNFIEMVFEAKPVLNQSLNFQHGSQQAVHQDTAFVRMNTPMHMAAIWVALEDVVKGSGELVYYPGSHRWEGFLFSNRFKHYDEERDGHAQLEQWYQWIHGEAERRGCTLQSFLPKKGDVFIWHAGLAHGGSEVSLPGCTRKSLVGHYCPQGVRPLYHYYKPAQRKLYSFGDYQYCTSYYRAR